MSRNKVAMKKTLPLMGSVLVTAVSLALAPAAALADDDSGMPFQGAMVVTATGNPNTGNVAYCGGSPYALVAEAHGNGYTSLGAFAFAFMKTVDSAGPMHGCAALTAANGDTLMATYDGTLGAADSNGFKPATGTLTITGGTGKFQNASGTVNFSAVFLGLYPGSSFTGGPPKPELYFSAFYILEGNVHIPAAH
jgi:hypothetical protein